jgi:Concanavalin A-like lectin/glucanases superfamily
MRTVLALTLAAAGQRASSWSSERMLFASARPFAEGASPRLPRRFVGERHCAGVAPLVLGLAMAAGQWGCGASGGSAGSGQNSAGSGMVATSGVGGDTGAVAGSGGGAATGSIIGSGASSGSTGSTVGSGALSGDSPDAAGGAPDATGAAPDAAGGDGSVTNPADSVVWQVDNLVSIGGAGHAPYPITKVGAPTVIDTPAGKAVQFGGANDALFVTNQPLDGLKQWTAEVIFHPDMGGAQAQRWFHIAGPGGANGDRVLFEYRLDAAANTWFLVSFVQGGGTGRLYAVAFPHPVGPWYHAAIVIDGTTMKHYINGVYEPAGPCGGNAGEGCTPATAPNVAAPFPLAYTGIGPGPGTSLGCRFTKAAFMKGAIRLARFTPRALTPAEFIPPPY